MNISNIHMNSAKITQNSPKFKLLDNPENLEK